MKLYYFLFLFVMSLLLHSCSDSVNQPDPLKNRIITTPLAQSAKFELDLNADGGYQWDYIISDTSVLKIDSTNYRPKSGNNNQIGGTIIETFYFTAKKRGQCTIDLQEHRVWEKNVSPINSFKYLIKIY